MSDIVLFGGSGHAKVIADMINRDGVGTIIGIVDNGGNTFWGIPLLGNDSDARVIHERYPEALAVVAIGDNTIRCRVMNMLRETGFKIASIISKDAVVSPTIKMASRGGVVIMPGAVVNVEVALGEGCIINTNASLDHEVEVGAFSHVAPGCVLSGNVKIGEKTWIGTGARIIEQIRIGESTVVGAGAVVVDDVPDGVLAVGVPAKVVRHI